MLVPFYHLYENKKSFAVCNSNATSIKLIQQFENVLQQFFLSWYFEYGRWVMRAKEKEFCLLLKNLSRTALFFWGYTIYIKMKNGEKEKSTCTITSNFESGVREHKNDKNFANYFAHLQIIYKCIFCIQIHLFRLRLSASN